MKEENLKVSQKALIQACKNLGVKYSLIHRDKILVKVELDPPLFFLHHYKAFNREDLVRISNDKDLQYSLLADRINIPDWKSYLDPNCNPKFRHIAEFNSIKKIADDISENFNFPIVVKRNKGSQGNHVFLCKDLQYIRKSLRKIFDTRSKHYDYIAIAQDFITIKSEYRVIGYKGNVLLNYEKDNKDADYQGNLSPLHWKGAKARLISDESLNKRIQDFIKPVFQVLPINFSGFDIAVDSDDKFWLIEINNSPGLSYFEKDNGVNEIVKMYEFILQDLINDQNERRSEENC
ncbi:alpha-L-glutamate ligase [Candidatus Dojkabacteria bacterium]|nr:alpha-L-glutamate ligase [Candidatus Dojkabacteria bacterium]